MFIIARMKKKEIPDLDLQPDVRKAQLAVVFTEKPLSIQITKQQMLFIGSKLQRCVIASSKQIGDQIFDRSISYYWIDMAAAEKFDSGCRRDCECN